MLLAENCKQVIVLVRDPVLSGSCNNMIMKIETDDQDSRCSICNRENTTISDPNSGEITEKSHCAEIAGAASS